MPPPKRRITATTCGLLGPDQLTTACLAPSRAVEREARSLPNLSTDWRATERMFVAGAICAPHDGCMVNGGCPDHALHMSGARLGPRNQPRPAREDPTRPARARPATP
jgi:hypothetical protein